MDAMGLCVQLCLLKKDFIKRGKITKWCGVGIWKRGGRGRTMIKIHSMKKLNIKMKTKNCMLSHSEILNIYIPTIYGVYQT